MTESSLLTDALHPLYSCSLHGDKEAAMYLTARDGELMAALPSTTLRRPSSFSTCTEVVRCCLDITSSALIPNPRIHDFGISVE